MKDHEITRMGLLNIQVCSTKTESEALEWVKLENPAGTTNNWVLSDDEKLKPVTCTEHPDRKHYVFTC